MKGGVAMEITGIPVLEILLLTIVFLGLLVEIKTGGLGAGVFLGLVAAAVFFGGRYMKGLVAVYPIAVFLGGVLCLVVEILAPSVGLLAGLGVAAMMYSVVLALGGDVNAVYALLASMLLAILIFALLVKRLPTSRLWRKLVLCEATTTDSGYVSTDPRVELVGQKGTAETDLRPAGSVSLHGEPFDVVSEGGYIPKGTVVIVVAVQGGRIVVRPIRGAA